MIHNPNLLTACDTVIRRCTTVCGGYHRSAWLFDKLMRSFDSDPAAVTVTIPVYINLVGPGTAEIGRDGSVIMRADH